MKRQISLAVCLMLSLFLYACGTQEPEAEEVVKEPESQTVTENSHETESVNTAYTVSENCVGLITISINPEIALEIDENGVVISVTYKNDDARDAYENLNLEEMLAEEAAELVVKVADEKGYLKDGGDVELRYGSTGRTSPGEAQEIISGTREALKNSLSEIGKDSAVVFQMESCGEDNTGICDLCYGVGVIVCDNCGGVSYGNGMTRCDLCSGSGVYEGGQDGAPDGDSADGLCRSCRGTGILTIQAQTCYTCNGTGLCINCGGSGVDPELSDRGETMSCHACDGTGDCLQEVCEGGIMVERSETCRDCGGTGQDTGNFSGNDTGDSGEEAKAQSSSCYRCDGNGYMLCNRCQGSLMQTCNRCNGTGINEH